MIPVEIHDGKVYFQDPCSEPLKQHGTEDFGICAFILGCDLCANTGFDLFYWSIGVSEVCAQCGAQTYEQAPYSDLDGDGWIDSVDRWPAKWTGGERDVRSVDTLVVHRYSRGRGNQGPRYVSDPHGRHVSWHATVHYEGFDRASTLHLQAGQIGWHAGMRSWNKRSIGVEIDAHPSGNVDAPYDKGSIDELCRLVEAWKTICPNLTQITGHADIIPLRRRDPGVLFPFTSVCKRTGLRRIHFLSDGRKSET